VGKKVEEGIPKNLHVEAEAGVANVVVVAIVTLEQGVAVADDAV
jgi:hypothetical protein